MSKLSPAQRRSPREHRASALLCVLCAGALLIACSKPSPAPVAPASAASPPSASEVAAPPRKLPTEAKASEPAPSYDEHTKAITAKAGAHFSVLLPANVTTPMKWRIQPAPNAAVLTLAGESYSETPPTNCAGCTGYPGTKRFDFNAQGAGKETLHLSYGSLTDASAKPEKELSIAITVE